MDTLIRHETLSQAWPVSAILELFDLPFMDLLLRAQTVHRRHHPANAVQRSSLLSIKTGACPEDCAYCPQSSRYATDLEQTPLMPLPQVLAAARRARDAGAQRFCMGAAWRSPTEKQLDDVIEHVQAVKALGMETCVTLGMLKPGQAERLKAAGLDYYNHNLDTSPEYYGEIIHTRTYDDRLQTLQRVRDAGLKVCCGGIVGLGESREIRAGLIAALASLAPYPESVPINQLVKVPGTPLADAPDLDPLEFVRTIAVTRIVMPETVVRLSAGRESMHDSTQALCFMAGANSIFYGEQLLTTPNPQTAADASLFQRLGLTPMPASTEASPN
ncbi:biotin synthase BioB [uncultured Castellaniella sp.]|uniref:biotin synthase BioB n=1 Tax=uncultured Castellaniella sp. TaxID=647907 RepID=UPI00261E015B|nr:biotin synthase BioB [uncultured Castellaniella sp.]